MINGGGSRRIGQFCSSTFGCKRSDESALKQAEGLGIITQYDKLAKNYLELSVQPALL
jgi:hypothetical protein